MKYLAAWVFPPLGALLIMRPVAAALMCLMCLTLILWPVASVWCYVLVGEAAAEARSRRLEAAIKSGGLQYNRPRPRSRTRDDREWQD